MGTSFIGTTGSWEIEIDHREIATAESVHGRVWLDSMWYNPVWIKLFGLIDYKIRLQ